MFLLEERVSNAELKITADAIVSTVTGSETYMQAQQKIYDDMDSLLGYRLEILAETVFLSENKRSTTLTAHVWHGNTEVTDSIAAERFTWVRESEDTTADAVWNSAHQGMRSILVTTADVLRQASFRCELTE